MYQRHRRKSTEKSNDTEPKTQKAIFIDSVNFTHSERICFEIEFVDTDQNYVQHALKEFGKDYGKNQDKGNHEFTFQNWTLKEHTNDIIWVSQDSVDKEISTDVWGKNF